MSDVARVRRNIGWKGAEGDDTSRPAMPGTSRPTLLLAAIVSTADPLAGQAGPQPVPAAGVHRAAGTSVTEAQRRFDQGLLLAFAGHEEEAAQAFRSAIGADPRCALCRWGLALALAPHLGAPMRPEDRREAREAVAAATRLGRRLDRASRELVDALADRLADEDPLRGPHRWAARMRRLASRHPTDGDVQLLFAEALLLTMPWDYWERDGSPRPALREALVALARARSVLANDPRVDRLELLAREAGDPAGALPLALRLAREAPPLGGLQGTASRHLLRAGRLGEAWLAATTALAADAAVPARARAASRYARETTPLLRHLAWGAALGAGRVEQAIAQADTLAAFLDGLASDPPDDGTHQYLRTLGLTARLADGRWEDVLRLRVPPASFPFARAWWHHARAIALARTGRGPAARREAAALASLAEHPALAGLAVRELNPLRQLLAIAERRVDAALAETDGATARAEALLAAAAAEEDRLLPSTPDERVPAARLELARLLLAGGNRAGAMAQLRTHLRAHPGAVTAERLLGEAAGTSAADPAAPSGRPGARAATGR